MKRIEKEREEKLKKDIADYFKVVNKNLKSFWEFKGESIVKSYERKLILERFKVLEPKDLETEICNCEIYVITANSVEEMIVSRWLREKNEDDEPKSITRGEQKYNFFSCFGYRIAHIVPFEKSSFSDGGSRDALKKAFEIHRPEAVFSIGVAFGADPYPNKQSLGDVLISKSLIRYDSNYKRTNGVIEIDRHCIVDVGKEIIAGCQTPLTCNNPTDYSVGSFNWYLGSMLTGGEVISDPNEMFQLHKACEKLNESYIGGEMEGSGIYTASKDYGKVPFLVIKGICDWAVNKNGWDFVSKDKETQKKIKDCVQAYACENACNTFAFVLDQVGFDKTTDLNEKRDWLDNCIENQKDIVNELAVFPWFPDSITYEESYPELFVHPNFLMSKEKKNYDDLLGYYKDNLVITGKAGAGKSTLLRNAFFALLEKGIKCIYITAKEIRDEAEFIDNLKKQKDVLVMIDGLDEIFYKDYEGYSSFIQNIKSCRNCKFWLGSRTDFYTEYCGVYTRFGRKTLEIQDWEESKSNIFIRNYARIQKKDENELINKIDNLLVDNIELKNNPFTLSVAVFLAENDHKEKITGTYSLYEKFLRLWIKTERDRKTTLLEYKPIVKSLIDIASGIYDEGEYLLETNELENSAIKNLLKIEERNIDRAYAIEFYHRSIASFLLAYATVTAIEEGNMTDFTNLCQRKLKDDVTNFIGDNFNNSDSSRRNLIVNNLKSMYSKCNEKTDIRVKEQIIYFISRVGVDVSDFLLQIIKENPQEPIMRLTLAYGCVLSENVEVRKYALDYAKSIANETDDTKTNRGWTVVYFGDVNNEDPYYYKDTQNGTWEKARKARIKRFTKKNPRIKDVRFWLFDIPLFHSFLKSRSWDKITKNDFEIIRKLKFSEEYFNLDEIAFLVVERKKLIEEYKIKLEEKEE